MNSEEIAKTDIWQLYEKSEKFMQRRGIYNDTDLNYRMYNGDQWAGIKLKGIEKIQYNIIKPIVNHKVSTITQNLFAFNYSPENLETPEFMEMATKACDLLNKKASKTFDKDFMDDKIVKWTLFSAINDEAICYVDYDKELEMPINEVIDKNDIMYGNENEEEIQLQPYILIRQRKSVTAVLDQADILGISEIDKLLIKGDNDIQTAGGDSAKDELEDNLWVITKFYKKDGFVHISQATRHVDLIEEQDTGLANYPIAHLNWEINKGNARGIGEIRQLIPNQLEINKTAMRRALVVKSTAYPQKVVNETAITNMKDVGKVGSIVRFKDLGNTAANQVFQVTQPAQMSSDSEKLQTEMISYSRELSNAGEATTGSINPEAASGKAILAVQQAQNQPLTRQLMALKTFLEEIAKIWFEMWKVYAEEGLLVEYEETDPMSGQVIMQQVQIPTYVMESLQTAVKIDITPKGAFDKYAQELSLENLLSNGQISFEEYVNSLDADSVMPKVKLEKIVKDRAEKQKQIQQMELQAKQMQMKSQQQLATAGDINAIDMQAQQMINPSQV